MQGRRGSKFILFYTSGRIYGDMTMTSGYRQVTKKKHLLTTGVHADMNAFPAGSDFTYWWPRNVDNMRKWQADRIRGWLANPRTREFKVVEEATGRMVAFAKWDLPKSLKGLDAGYVKESPKEEGKGEGGAEGEAQKGPGAPEGCNLEMYKELFDSMNIMREKWQVDDKLRMCHAILLLYLSPPLFIYTIPPCSPTSCPIYHLLGCYWLSTYSRSKKN